MQTKNVTVNNSENQVQNKDGINPKTDFYTEKNNYVGRFITYLIATMVALGFISMVAMGFLAFYA